MSDLESFFGFDKSDTQGGAEALQALRNQMQENAKHIKALQKAEAKQKKKEDRLAKIISNFFQKKKKDDLLILITKLLELNIPADFILSLILLGNEEIQEETGVKLTLPENISLNNNSLASTNELQIQSSNPNQQITLFSQKSVLPLKIKISLELWGKNIYETIKNNPQKILGTILDEWGNLKLIVINTATKIIHDFLNQNEIYNIDHQKIHSASQTILQGIIKKIQQETNQQKLLEQKK